MASYTPAPSDIAYQRELTIQTATVFFSVSGGALFLVAIACCAGRCYLYRRRNNARNAILPVGSRGGSRVHNDGLSSSMMTEAIRQAMDDSDATARGSRSALVHKGAGHGQGTGEPPVLKTADVSLHSLRKQLSRRSSAELSSVVHYNEHGEVQTVGALSLGKDAVATAISTLASALPVAAVATLAVAPSSNLPVPQINTILATPITSPIAQRNRLPNSASSPSSPGASSVTAALLHSTGYFRNNNSSGNGGHTSSNNYNDSIGKDMVSLMKHSSSHLRLSVSANGSVSQGSLSQGSGLRLASSASRVMLPSAGSLFLDPTPYDAAATTPSAANGGAPRGADSSPSAAAAVPAGDMIYPVLHVEPSPDQNIESAPLPTKNSPPPPLPQSASEFCEVVAADDSWWIPAHSIAVDFDTALGEDGYQSTHFAKITDKDLVLAHCHVISPPPGSAGKTGEPVSLVVILASASTDNLVAPRGRGLWEFVRKRRDQLAPLPSSSSPLGSPTEMTDAVECWLPHMVVTLWAQEIQLLRSLAGCPTIQKVLGATAFPVDPLSSSPTWILATTFPMAKPLAELVFNRTIDWFDDDSAIILHDISAALTFIHGRGLGHGALTVLDVWMVPRPVAVGGAGIGGLDFAVQAIVGGLGLGQYVGGVQRRLATHAQQLQSDPAMAVDAPDAVRAHIFARYLDPALLAHQQRHGVARNNNNNNEVDPLALLPVSATQAADLYSFGLLVYELVTRVPLLVHASPVEVQLQLASGVRPPIDLRRWLANASVRHSEGESVVRRIRVGLVELLTRCWANNAGDRPTAARVEGTMTKIVDEIRRAWGVAVGVARI